MKKTLVVLMLLFIISGAMYTNIKAKPTKKDVYEAYAQVLDDPNQFDFTVQSPPTPEFTYSLAQIDDSDIPLLILAKKDVNQSYYENLFIKLVGDDICEFNMGNPIMTGVGDAGGFRGGLMASNNKDGIYYTQFSSGNGRGTVDKFSFSYPNVNKAQVFEGVVPTYENPDMKPLGSHNIKDRYFLAKEILGKDNEITKKEIDKTIKQAKDEGKYVLTGKVMQMNGTDLIKLQNIDFNNPSMDESKNFYAILLLDKPMDLDFVNGDGQGKSQRSEHIIRLGDKIDYLGIRENNYDIWNDLNGKRVSIIVDPKDGLWPSDASLPLGSPSISNYDVIELE